MTATLESQFASATYDTREAAIANDRWNMQRIRTQLDRIMCELRSAAAGSPIDRMPRAAKLTDWSARMVAAAEIVALLDAGKISSDEARAGVYGITGERDPDAPATLARLNADRKEHFDGLRARGIRGDLMMAEAASDYVKQASRNRAPRVGRSKLEGK